ncbi:MAG TPA: glycosyltransferase [Acidovorax sp.]|nr:glycosyltransferase [Acidovorax sp.]
MPPKILLMAHDVTLAHLGRPLRLAEGLIADGHDVTLAASAESARFLQQFPGRVHRLASTGKARFIDNLAKGRPVFDFETLKRFAEEDEALLASLQPELVIGDFRLSLSVSARRAGVPYATITNAYWSPAFTPRFVVPDLPMLPYLGVGISQFLFDLARPFAFAYHARPMNALRRHYGMPSLGHDLRRIYTDADLALFSDVPQIYALPDGDLPGSVFLGPIGWSPDVPLPDWWGRLDPRRPLIYVTLGSSGDGKLLPDIIRQLGVLDAQLVVATAGATLAAGLPDVFAADYLPGEQVAARANLVICNGGSPTSSQAIAQGVPVLAVPGNLDQYLNMHYLEKCGLGLTVRNQNLGDGLLVTAARRMLNNPEFRRNAQRYAEIFRRYDPQARLATAIAKLCPSH